MPNFQEKGIYSGGAVTKGSGADTHLYISPFMLNLYDGDVTGAGETQTAGVAKVINIQFGGVPGGVVTPSEPYAPSYTIRTGASAGSVWIYFNESSLDISFSSAPISNVIVFAKVSWTTPLNMANVTINTDYIVPPTAPNRTEAYVAESRNPQTAEHFYYDGQQFIGGKLNKPLANMALAIEALQDESLSLLGDTFFITLATTANITGNGLDLALSPVKHYARTANTYKTYNTKEDPALGSGIAIQRTFDDYDEINGDNIYIVIHRTTGVPGIYLASAESGSFDINTTHYLIARSVAPHVSGVLDGVSDLDDVVFEVVNNLVGLNQVKETFSTYIDALHPSGFFRNFKVEGVPGFDNRVSYPDLWGHVRGSTFKLFSGSVTLPSPPSSGTRQDFVFLQVNKRYTPDILIESSIRVFTNCNFSTYPDPFDNPGLLSLLDDGVTAGNAFTLQEDGVYESTGNTGSTEYYALPLAIVQRLNTGAYADGNPLGGTSRPDGKTALRINTSEVLTTAPIIPSRADKKALLTKAIKLLLKGDLNSAFNQIPGSSGGYSTRPLYVDSLGSYSVGTDIGALDGARRFWSGNPGAHIPMSFTCPFNAAFTYPYVTYTYSNPGPDPDDDVIVLTLRIPLSFQNDASIVTDETGQPAGVEVKWVSDGTPVDLVEPWTSSYNGAGDLVVTSEININTSAASYASHAVSNAEIAVSFKVRYASANTLSAVPSVFYKALRNNTPGKANYYALASDLYTNPTTSLVLDSDNSRSVTVDGDVYRDVLQIQRAGATVKGYAHTLKYVIAGNNLTNTAYSIPTTYVVSSDFPVPAGTYNLLHLVDVLDKNGSSIGVTYTEWNITGSVFKIKLGVAVPTTDPVYFVFGLDGSQVDYSQGSLEISNLTHAERITGNTAPSAEYFYWSYFDTVNNIGGHPIFGFTASKNKLKIYAEANSSGVEYLEVPTTVTGFETGLLKISTVTTTAQYNALSVEAKTVYQVNPGDAGGYRIVPTRPLMFSILRAYNESTTIVFSYDAGASPFRPFDDSVPATVIESGYLITTTDGTANESTGPHSPVSKRFPVVQNIDIIGAGVPASFGINAVDSNTQQLGEWYSSGSDLILDGRYHFNATVSPGTGMLALLSLVKQGNSLLLFAYLVRDGFMILNNPAQAFVAELSNNLKEFPHD